MTGASNQDPLHYRYSGVVTAGFALLLLLLARIRVAHLGRSDSGFARWVAVLLRTVVFAFHSLFPSGSRCFNLPLKVVRHKLRLSVRVVLVPPFSLAGAYKGPQHRSRARNRLRWILRFYGRHLFVPPFIEWLPSSEEILRVHSQLVLQAAAVVQNSCMHLQLGLLLASTCSLHSPVQETILQ